MLVSLITIAALVPGASEGHDPATPSAAANSAPPSVAESCPLDADEEQWLRLAIDNWTALTRDLLQIPTEPLPWVVSYDDSCVWHLGTRQVGENAVELESDLPVSAFAQRHDGTIELPSGNSVPARPQAFASLVEDGSEAFFVLALRDVWVQAGAGGSDFDLEPFLLGLAAHEMVHTRQLVEMSRRVDDLRARCELPETISDDTIQTVLIQDPEFERSLLRERDLWLDAATATPANRRRLAMRALEALERRRSQFFSDETACYADLEDLFLALEGTATWTHFQLARTGRGVRFLARHPEATSRAEVIEIIRGRTGEWVQDVGLAIFLLLDELDPDWRQSFLAGKLASSVRLLGRAVHATPSGDRPAS